jgi:hypothetical protein
MLLCGAFAMCVPTCDRGNSEPFNDHSYGINREFAEKLEGSLNYCPDSASESQYMFILQ